MSINRTGLILICCLILTLPLMAKDLPTLSPPNEPGEPLVVTGTVFHADGTTPAEGVDLFVYHADINGYYSGTTIDSSNPRNKANLKTDAEGHFAFRTVRPGGYPNNNVPAHIHFKISHKDYPDQQIDLQFVGDPNHSERAIERSKAAGRFGVIQPLTQDENGTWQGIRDIRLQE